MYTIMIRINKHVNNNQTTNNINNDNIDNDDDDDDDDDDDANVLPHMPRTSRTAGPARRRAARRREAPGASPLRTTDIAKTSALDAYYYN